MFSDLETDYINPIDFCNKMNKVRGLVTSSSTLKVNTAATLVSLSYLRHSHMRFWHCYSSYQANGQRFFSMRLCWHIMRTSVSVSLHIFWRETYFRIRILKQNHMYDATEIFRTMGPQKNEIFIKLGFYLLSFFYYLYRYVFRSCANLLLYVSLTYALTAWFSRWSKKIRNKRFRTRSSEQTMLLEIFSSSFTISFRSCLCYISKRLFFAMIEALVS